MTRAQIRFLTRQYLRELATGDAPWQKRDLDSFVDRGYDEVCLLAELIIGEAFITSVASQMTYTLAAVHHRVLRTWYKDPTTGKFGRKLAQKPLAELDALDFDWTDDVATSGTVPTSWTVRGRSLLLIPAPFEAQTNGIRIWTVQTPTALTAEADIPAIPNGYHEAIALAAARRAMASRPPQTANPVDLSAYAQGVAALDKMFAQSMALVKRTQDRERMGGARLVDLREVT